MEKVGVLTLMKMLLQKYSFSMSISRSFATTSLWYLQFKNAMAKRSKVKLFGLRGSDKVSYF